MWAFLEKETEMMCISVGTKTQNKYMFTGIEVT